MKLPTILDLTKKERKKPAGNKTNYVLPLYPQMRR